MGLCELLDIRPGTTAVIGSGGKTTLLSALSRELRAKGRTVILTTTTHILPFEDIPLVTDSTAENIAAALETNRVICVGTPTKDGKLAAPVTPIEDLAAIAGHVLVEADGSRRLPLKAHAAHEPVVPACANQTILVVGASGLNRPIADVVHRPELFCALLGCDPTNLATPELVARALLAENLATKVLVNQVDTPKDRLQAKLLASYMDVSVVAGSLRDPASFRTLN